MSTLATTPRLHGPRREPVPASFPDTDERGSIDGFTVTGLRCIEGYEEIRIFPRGGKWRAYWYTLESGYSTSYGRSGQTMSCKLRSVRDGDGKTIVDVSAEAVFDRLRALDEEDGILP